MRELVELRPSGDALILGDCTFHEWWARGGRGDLSRFAAAAGFDSVDTVDLFGEPTIRLDLGQPVPEELHGRYDWVIDAGTIFCCFDVAAVWRNALAMLKPGGTIFHNAGLTGYFGRSYYSFQPALFRDFYAVNGFEVTRMAVRGTRDQAEYVPIEADQVYAVDGPELRWAAEQNGAAPALPTDAVIVCAARQVEERPFTNAVPAHYATATAEFGRLAEPAASNVSARMLLGAHRLRSRLVRP